jgi:hypothetical protein
VCPDFVSSTTQVQNPGCLATLSVFVAKRESLAAGKSSVLTGAATLPHETVWRTEAVLSTLGAIRVPRRHLLLLKTIGIPARFAILTFYVLLGWAILQAVRPMSMLGIQRIDTLTWSSAGTVADFAMLFVLMPLYASHSWASAESAPAIAAVIPSPVGDQQNIRKTPNAQKLA